LAQVKANLDARAADPSVPPLAWTLPTLRKAWNQTKDEVAPWWPACSKEASASGIADLVTTLHAWSGSKNGYRAGPRMGFPRFKSRRHDRGRVRFHNGAMRLETDRRHLVLPVIGKLRSKENTRRLQRPLVKGSARILSMTLTEQRGRLFVSVATVAAQAPCRPNQPDAAAGSILASAPNGRWSRTPTTPSSGSPIPRPGLRPNPSVGGSPGRRRAAPSAPEDIAKRKPSWRPWTGARPTCAANPSTPSRPG
jgi:putative transposase